MQTIHETGGQLRQVVGDSPTEPELSLLKRLETLSGLESAADLELLYSSLQETLASAREARGYIKSRALDSEDLA